MNMKKITVNNITTVIILNNTLRKTSRCPQNVISSCCNPCVDNIIVFICLELPTLYFDSESCSQRVYLFHQ